MSAIRKFYDGNGKEVDAKDAVKCVQLTLNDSGKVIKTEMFLAVKK